MIKGFASLFVSRAAQLGNLFAVQASFGKGCKLFYFFNQGSCPVNTDDTCSRGYSRYPPAM
jgi:hypothetical protein